MLDPDMPTDQLKIHMGEMTAQDIRTARAAIRWANAEFSAPAPDSAKDPFNPGCETRCYQCGEWESVVRPGKTQCENWKYCPAHYSTGE